MYLFNSNGARQHRQNYRSIVSASCVSFLLVSLLVCNLHSDLKHILYWMEHFIFLCILTLFFTSFSCFSPSHSPSPSFLVLIPSPGNFIFCCQTDCTPHEFPLPLSSLNHDTTSSIVYTSHSYKHTRKHMHLSLLISYCYIYHPTTTATSPPILCSCPIY